MAENGEPYYGETISSEEKTVSLKSLKQRDSCRGVLAIDQYAETLMNELGVIENSGVAPLGAKLASATTRKKRHGFIEAQQLAEKWKKILQMTQILWLRTRNFSLFLQIATGMIRCLEERREEQSENCFLLIH